MPKRIVPSVLFTLLFTAGALAQMGGKRPSPPASATCDLGSGKTIKTDYSSPRMKGRKIYGETRCPSARFGALGRTKPPLLSPAPT